MSETIKISTYEAKLMGVIGSAVNFTGFLLIIFGLFTGLFRLRLFAGITVIFGFLMTVVGLIIVYIGLSSLSRKIGNDMIRKFYLNYIVIRIVSSILFIAFLYIVSTIDIRRFLEVGGRDIFKLIIALPIGIVSYVLMIISVIELRNSYELLRSACNIELFSIAGYIYSIGALLLIVIIGFVILLIAPLIEIISWNALPDYLEKTISLKTS